MASVRKRKWTHKSAKDGVVRTGESWVVEYTDKGKRHTKTFKIGQKKAADKYRTQVETEIAQGIHTADSASITVKEAVEIWLERCKQRVKLGLIVRTTYDAYLSSTRNHVLPFLGREKLSQLTIPIIQKWVDQLVYKDAPIGDDSLNVALLCMRETIKMAQVAGSVSHNVLTEFKPNRPKKRKSKLQFPTKDELKLLLSTASGIIRMPVFLAIFTGMRKSEIRGLTWDNVDFEACLIRVRQRADKYNSIGRTKTEAGIRDIPISPALVQLLKEWKIACPITDENFVVVGPGNKILGDSWCKRLWNKLKKQAGVSQNLRFHSLRHATASLLIEQGVQPKRIQQIMGHASITMTFDRYGRLFDDADTGHNAMAKIDGILLG